MSKRKRWGEPIREQQRASVDGLPPGYKWTGVPSGTRPPAGSGYTAKAIRSPGGTLCVGVAAGRSKATRAAIRLAWEDYSQTGGKG